MGSRFRRHSIPLHSGSLRARFVQRYGGLALEPLREQGSAMLRTLSEADALVAVPPEGARAGEPVDAIPLAALD